MWFGNLVTMEWFNDVWTKEVFANFMAAKIVNPSFPDINHDLNFLVQHYPSAYSVDRTAGANPIRQTLPNLNEAGQMYGAIIYDKAPIMMRQLETMLGADNFREGMREYLASHAFGNATWPKLIEILDARSEGDLQAWSDVWVNTAGRPEFEWQPEADASGARRSLLLQHDPSGFDRAWPQRFSILLDEAAGTVSREVLSAATATVLDTDREPLVFNADGMGYGLFPATPAALAAWDRLDEVSRASLLINLYENLLAGNGPRPAQYIDELAALIPGEQNQLLLNLIIGQLRRIYWTLLPVDLRVERTPAIEQTLWRAMQDEPGSSRRKILFDAFADVALSPDEVEKIRAIWSGELEIDNLPLSENDRIDLAQMLAIKLPARAAEIMAQQIEATANPDNLRKLEFIAPSVVADRAERDRFFHSLADASMRTTESWVLDALANLHHPLRTQESEAYIRPSLELLQEIQVTGDIFFPKAWLDATLSNYRSATAAETVRAFLDERPDYNQQLRMKILQSADMLFRANAIRAAERERQQASMPSE
jgi:aminopeptidase N